MSMLKKLFGSRTRINILRLFAFNPRDEYYAREIERLTKEPFDPLRRELIRLESVGLLKSRISGKQRYYSVNTAHLLFSELKTIILKTVGLGDVIRDAVKEKDDVSLAFIYGSYAKNTENINSDVDLFVIGDISLKNFQEMLSHIEAQVKREISPVIYSADELRSRYKARDHFINSVLKEPKIFLKGDDYGLRKLVSGRKAR